MLMQTEGRSRRSSSNNNSIVSTSGKRSLCEFALANCTDRALAVRLEEEKIANNYHCDCSSGDVSEHLS